MSVSEHEASSVVDVESAVAEITGLATRLAREIYEDPELSKAEHNARRRCVEVLVSNGFDLTDVPGVETAFVATVGSSTTGLTIGLLAEYDALPGVGHACGHHLIAGSAVGAGLALARRIDQLGCAVKVFGCPAEEVGYGKAAMIEAGAFEGTDVCLTFHANDISSVMTRSTAIHELLIRFSGRASHAAIAPWEGASALDGVLLTYQNINALRQFVRDGVRIHGVVTSGGDAFNVIPEEASCRLAVRSADPTELDRVVRRVTDCVQAAAVASGTEVEIEQGMLVESVVPNSTIGDVIRDELASVCGGSCDWDLTGSTDFGNVSKIIPSALFSIPTWPTGTVLHTREAAERGGEPPAFDALLNAIRVMARAASKLAAEPGIIAEARAELSSSAPAR